MYYFTLLIKNEILNTSSNIIGLIVIGIDSNLSIKKIDLITKAQNIYSLSVKYVIKNFINLLKIPC